MAKSLLSDSVFICAAEASGDLYARLFLESKIRHDKIYGVGGREMAKAGVKIIIDYQDLMTFGLASGLVAILRNYKIYKKIARALFKIKPHTFIAVSYPGINLLLCRYAKKLGIKVWYLLPPQIWAWGTFRKYFIKKWVDEVVSVFPFEYHFLNSKNIKTRYWKNPLIAELKKYKKNDFQKRIGFMPGSRISEIKRNLPIISALIDKIGNLGRDLELVLILQPQTVTGLADSITHNSKFKIITQNRYQAMRNCDLLVTCSGTASLEGAIMAIPQVFFNRPSFIDYYLFRHFLKIREFNLANLYFEKKVVPAFVSCSATLLKKSLSAQIFKLLKSQGAS